MYMRTQHAHVDMLQSAVCDFKDTRSVYWSATQQNSVLDLTAAIAVEPILNLNRGNKCCVTFQTSDSQH